MRATRARTAWRRGRETDYSQMDSRCSAETALGLMEVQQPLKKYSTVRKPEKYLKKVLLTISSPALIPRCLDFFDQIINRIANALKDLTVRILRREIGRVRIVKRNAAAKRNHAVHRNAKRAQRRALKSNNQSLDTLS